MPFSYHPPTRTRCDVCLQLHSFDRNAPIIDSFNGKASSADNYPFHNWYNFVLGYSPEFPKYMLQRESITTSDLVIDPFMGSGTTLVACKMLRVPSMGLDANDFMVDAARVKLDWDLDAKGLKRCRDQVLERSEALF
ncbi:MAG: hypothetical protein FJY85_07280, partial [Deltaproteobacteria bacterium]|nr:hypothetical protein [Deltaproteobacteria bacterium]